MENLNNLQENTELNILKFQKMFNEILNAQKELVANQDIEDLVLQGDNVDQYNIEKEKVLALRLKGRNGIYFKKLTKALKKIDEGTFGICEECGCNISERRLLARPTADLCIACKEAEELDENKTFTKNRASAKVSETDRILKFKNLDKATKAIDNGFTDIA